MRLLLSILLAVAMPSHAGASFDCIPGVYGEQIGSVRSGRSVDQADGRYVYWFCKRADGRLVWPGLYCSGDRCPADLERLRENIALATAGIDVVAAIKAMASAFVFDEPPCRDVVGGTAADRVCLAWEDDIHANFPDGWDKPARLPPRPPPPPPSETWKVKASGTAINRVVYTISGGRRAALTNPLRTVPIGSPCDPAVRVEESLGTAVTVYMGVPGGIAVCERQP